MTETADPRIALLQKWSQENPELLAQAGLASSFEGGTHLGVFANTSQQAKHYEQHKDAYHNLHNVKAGDHKRKGNKKHNKNTRNLMQYSKQEIVGVAKAAQSGVLTVHGNQHASTHTKNKKKNVKYTNLAPDELSKHTEAARLELEKNVPSTREIKTILERNFAVSDIIRDATNTAESFSGFFSGNKSSSYEQAYSVLHTFINNARHVETVQGVHRNIGIRLRAPDFSAYGPQTKPLMQKAFLVKSLYEVLFKRYIKSIPPKSKQDQTQTGNLQTMIHQYKLIDKPYRKLHDYGKAMRVQHNKAVVEHKPYSYANHALKQELDDTPATFSMAQPYIQ